MDERWYFVPEVPPPWKQGAGQRPKYMAELKCDWNGYPLSGTDYFFCVVTASARKHTQLREKPGVIVVPRRLMKEWDPTKLTSDNFYGLASNR